MRNGDAYKIKNLALQGRTAEQIKALPQMRSYSVEEIQRFMPVSESDTPKPKKKARRKAAAKG